MKGKLLILLLCLPMMLMAQKKVAVYVTSEAESVDNATQQIIGGELVSAIVKNSQYKAVERTSDFLKQISKEQGYQHSGNVDDQQISALGKQFGVDYVCVASIMPYKKSYYLQVRLIDVETATVQNIARETSSFSNLDEIIRVAGNVAHQLLNSDEAVFTPEPQKPVGTELVRLSSSERKLTGKKEFVLGETEMDSKELLMFFNKNCNRACSQYYSGKSCITAGWTFFGVGVFLFVGGISTGFYAVDKRSELERQGYDYNTWNIITEAGFAAHTVGGILTTTSIVLLPIGYTYRNKAIKSYNTNNCARRNVACSFDLQASENGIGLAMTF